MVLANGKVIFSYGDVGRVSKIASVRKSILAMLMGKYVIEGKIDTSKNVKQLGLDDQIPFTPLEGKATLEQLMTARSGIYRDLPDPVMPQSRDYRSCRYPRFREHQTQASWSPPRSRLPVTNLRETKRSTL